MNIPNSDTQLSCIVNMSGAAAHPAHRKKWLNTAFITDLSMRLADDPDPAMTDQYIRLLTKGDIGSYISLGRVEKVQKQWPAETVPWDKVDPSWLREGTETLPAPRINIGYPGIRTVFADLIVKTVNDRPGPWLFGDNIIHPSTDSKWYPWEDSCDLLSIVQMVLHKQGIKLIANVSGHPASMLGGDALALSQVVDGMSFEIPFYWKMRGDYAQTINTMEAYRYWLDHGKAVVMIAKLGNNADGSRPMQVQGDTEALMMAAFAMMIREPGDRLYVSWAFWRDQQDWFDWPARLGKPLYRASFLGGPDTLTREFENGQLTVNTVTRAVRLE